MSRLLNWALRFLWVPGIALLCIGIIGDVQNWWDELGYTSNMVAGATGACFGVPIAYFVIQRLSRERDERRGRESLEGRTLEQVVKFKADAEILLTSDRQILAEMTRDAGRLTAFAVNVKWLWGEGYKVGSRRLEEAHRHSRRLRANVESLRLWELPEATDPVWARLCSRWALLERELLPRATLEGIDVLPPHLSQDIGTYLQETKGDFSSFYEYAGSGDLDYIDEIISEAIEKGTGLPPPSDGKDVVHELFEEGRLHFIRIGKQIKAYEQFLSIVEIAENMAREKLLVPATE
ncbi:hypothetical protein [Actinomycetospora sp. CA-053990]|uniref:hypothetical protein n=1 Tax=Actinomycetospora sp. CA-053990 TaxID=3239891 RepID=UPI003D8F53D2